MRDGNTEGFACQYGEYFRLKPTYEGWKLFDFEQGDFVLSPFEAYL